MQTPEQRLFTWALFQALQDAVYEGKKKNLKLARRQAISFFNAKTCRVDLETVCGFIGLDPQNVVKMFKFYRRHPKELKKYLRDAHRYPEHLQSTEKWYMLKERKQDVLHNCITRAAQSITCVLL